MPYQTQNSGGIDDKTRKVTSGGLLLDNRDATTDLFPPLTREWGNSMSIGLPK